MLHLPGLVLSDRKDSDFIAIEDFEEINERQGRGEAEAVAMPRPARSGASMAGRPRGARIDLL